jgi:predicted molibdopterin-dependent oxidoreductase YjgC
MALVLGKELTIHQLYCTTCTHKSLSSCLQALKTKQKVTDQKLQQAEESYSQAKLLYDEITDELYEELPTFFDRYVEIGKGLSS